jgi:ATP-dependent Clp protease ATP-binding subunit ClpC
MFERFTDQTRRVVVLAQEEARLLNHRHIGTEHLLLGLLRERDGTAAHVLTDAGLSLETVRGQLSETAGAGGTPLSGHIPFTPRAKKVLEFSLREALQFGADFIGTEHLLLGLIREGEGSGARIIEEFAGSLSAVRSAVIAAGKGRADRRTGAPSGEGVSVGEQRFATVRGVAPGREFPLPGTFAREYPAGPMRVPAHAADPVVPRPAETERLLTVLGRRHGNNALIVGPSGAGKTALMRGLARLLAANRGPAALGGAELLELDLLALRSGADRLVRRAVSPVVLIEDLDTVLASDGLSGGRMVMTLAGLAASEVPCVLTGTGAAHARLEQGFPALASRFTAIDLPAAGQVLTMEVLQALRPALLEFHRIVIEDSALAAAVELGARATGGRVLPGAAVDVLDTASARLSAARPEGEEGEALLGADQLRALYTAELSAGSAPSAGSTAPAGSAGSAGQPAAADPAAAGGSSGPGGGSATGSADGTRAPEGPPVAA